MPQSYTAPDTEDETDYGIVSTAPVYGVGVYGDSYNDESYFNGVAFSVSLAVRFHSGALGTDRVIFSCCDSGGVGIQLLLDAAIGTDLNRVRALYEDDDGDEADAYDTLPLSDQEEGEWVRYIVVFDSAQAAGSQLKLYKNRVLATGSSLGDDVIPLTGTNDFILGYSPALATKWGDLDIEQVALFDYALSDADIAALAGGGSAYGTATYGAATYGGVLGDPRTSTTSPPVFYAPLEFASQAGLDFIGKRFPVTNTAAAISTVGPRLGYSSRASNEFLVIVLPDTQVYANNEAHTPTFVAACQWISDHYNEANAVNERIAFAVHVGDLVETASDADNWSRIETALKDILLADGVPFSVLPGNHDSDPDGSRDYDDYNTHYSPSVFSGMVEYVGSKDSGDNANNYCLFSAGGLDYLVLSLEFGPRAATLTWAAEIVNRYPNRWVIVVTHTYQYYERTAMGGQEQDPRSDINDTEQTAHNPHTYDNGVSADCNDGEEMWDNFVKLHRNILMVISGHIIGVEPWQDESGYRSDSGDLGNTVHQFLYNRQQVYEGGGRGHVRIMRFVPNERKIHITSFTPTRYDASVGQGKTHYDLTDDDTFSVDFSFAHLLLASRPIMSRPPYHRPVFNRPCGWRQFT